MSEEFNQIRQCLENLCEYLEDVRRIFVQFIQTLTEDIFKPPTYNRRISYNAVYWKIIDSRRLDIDLMVSSFGINEKSYYHKIDR